ncbi:MAG: hypothetical protein V7K50_23040 [Nostoc sp.]|uniref:hypothetical protein n=1 Tax=Nostoc sp. TaxID=1180 RepID=UPI002FFCFC05
MYYIQARTAIFIGAIVTNRLNEFFTLKQLCGRSPINIRMLGYLSLAASDL